MSGQPTLNGDLMKTFAATTLSVFLFCTLLCAAPDRVPVSMQVYGQAPEGEAKVVAKAPKSVNVGDMIVIDLSESVGSGFDYIVEPTPPNLRTFDNGQIIVCGTGATNVTYTFAISCAVDST